LKVFKYIISLTFILIVTRTAAQDNDVIISADFQDTPFSEFVNRVEQQTDVRFYYNLNLVKDIRISASGQQVSLNQTLSQAFRSAGLKFYISGDKQVFVTGRQILVTSLPDYSVKTAPSEIQATDEDDNGMTASERKYLETRKSGTIETIVVGEE
jgi:hypothetical protein